MRARLAQARRRAGSASARPDGFPMSSGWGPRGSRTGDPTTAAAGARAPRDSVREEAMAALLALDRCVIQLMVVHSRVRVIDQAGQSDALPTEAGYSAMAAVGIWEPVRCHGLSNLSAQDRGMLLAASSRRSYLRGPGVDVGPGASGKRPWTGPTPEE